MNEKLTTQQRLELVLNAISRIRAAKVELRSLYADPSVGESVIANFKKFVESIEHEFCWQWENVERIFKDKGIIP